MVFLLLHFPNRLPAMFSNHYLSAINPYTFLFSKFKSVTHKIGKNLS